ncbi:thiolase C-terminal domain-containing protein [Leptospira sp. GIMC2001]|uniref:thiolase C-terminal domain-containing protein n=1 Tax=Leptospira sp. GIMC2001 TaxID=1513297 RepID=UPI00234AA8BC|nr:OB-fold domain-containing protein [Leptospira sp. GIMC2001]WCL49312.1 OB-fold domain-containing protein [Leptospira sp. GIMC2001]
MSPIILGVCDSIESDISNYQELSNYERYFALLESAVDGLCNFLGTDRTEVSQYLTDFVSIDAAALARTGYGQMVKDANDLGFTGIQCHTVDLGGASVCGAIGEAWRIAESNPYAVILVAGADVPKSVFRQVSDLKKLTATVANSEYEIPYGATLIAMYGLLANKQMQDNDIDISEYENITKYFRNIAIENPRSFYYRKEIIDKQFTKFLAYPYSTPMIAIVTDHGFATIVVGHKAHEELIAKSVIKEKSNPLYLIGTGHCIHSEYFSLKSKLESPAGIAAERAFASAGCNRNSIEYAWIYDCFIGMIISQASAYFGENPKKVAEALQNGKIPIGDKEIPINMGGGILNYQAAMSMSGATGLVDVLSQYGLSKNPLPLSQKLTTPPKLSLLGGNGGIDSINSVALFSQESANTQSQRKPIIHRRLKLNKIIHPEKNTNSTIAKNNIDQSQNQIPNEQTERIGTILTSTVVYFNPGGEKKTPYVLALVSLENGNFVMTNIYQENGDECRNLDLIKNNHTKIRIIPNNNIWKGIIVE